MLRVLLEKGRYSLACRAEGHALFDKKGQDIVCAAATALIRTAMQTLQDRPAIVFEGGAPVRGETGWTARAAAGSQRALTEINFAADFLEQGFRTLSREFPQNITFECKSK